MTDRNQVEPVDVSSIMEGAYVQRAPGRAEPGETWKLIPGFPFYEVSDHGRVRSIPREAYGRTWRQVVLASRESNSGYMQVNLRDADGKTRTRTVHTLMLEAFAGPRPDGQEARHLNDIPTDNRWPANLVWGTKAENAADKFANGRPRAAEKPPKVCPRCQAEHRDPGRRCHACVVEIGEELAKLLVAGVPLDQAADRLDYPSHSGALVLAQKYGGLRLTLAPAGDLVEQFADPALTGYESHGVTATLRDWWRKRRRDAR